jgi:hypothetical protein
VNPFFPSMPSKAANFRSACAPDRGPPECSSQRFPAGTPQVGTGDDRYLLGREFTLLHSTRMQLHPVANLSNLGHRLTFRIPAIPLLSCWLVVEF